MCNRDFPSVYLAPSFWMSVTDLPTCCTRSKLSLQRFVSRSGTAQNPNRFVASAMVSGRCYVSIFCVSNLRVVIHWSMNPIQRRCCVKVYGIWQADSKTDVGWIWIWLVTVRSRQTLFIRCDAMPAEIFERLSQRTLFQSMGMLMQFSSETILFLKAGL